MTFGVELKFYDNILLNEILREETRVNSNEVSIEE